LVDEMHCASLSIFSSFSLLTLFSLRQQ